MADARYERVGIAAVAYEAPPEVMTSDDIEAELAPLYERIGLVPGRLELMTGIRERRFWPGPIRPSSIATHAGRKALQQADVDPSAVGALVFSSVCRDQLEPASAHAVHHALGLAPGAYVFDISNACLGVLNGVNVVANMIELGHIECGLVVAGEDGLPLVRGTIDRLRTDVEVTRRSVKLDFASLTIGSGAAAVLLKRTEPGADGPSLLGSATRVASEHHDLCVGGLGDGGSMAMATDAEMLLESGLDLARATYVDFRAGAAADGLDRVVTHQVGKIHHRRLLEELDIAPERTFTTYETFGNVGSVSLPLTLARAVESGFVTKGHRVGLLGIGSGLGCMMVLARW
jgi:3-oxoacyl-[acyl-carrier-protein] synthase-3